MIWHPLSLGYMLPVWSVYIFLYKGMGLGPCMVTCELLGLFVVVWNYCFEVIFVHAMSCLHVVQIILLDCNQSTDASLNNIPSPLWLSWIWAKNSVQSGLVSLLCVAYIWAVNAWYGQIWHELQGVQHENFKACSWAHFW